jgi:hypothetical protein
LLFIIATYVEKAIPRQKKILDGHLPPSPSYNHYFLKKYGCSTICPTISNMVLPIRRVCLKEVCTEWRGIFCRHTKCRIRPAYYIKFRERRTEYSIVE